MTEMTFAGVGFRVTAATTPNAYNLEFVGVDGGPMVAVMQYDDDASGRLHVALDGEIELAALEEVVAYAKQRLSR